MTRLHLACIGCFAGLLVGCQTLSRPGKLARPGGLISDNEAVALNGAQKADMLFAIGRSHEARGDSEQAIRSYYNAHRQDPRRPEPCHRLAIQYDLSGSFEQSARWYDAALKRAPGHPDVLADRGYGLYLQQRWQEAEDVLRQAVADHPDHVRARNHLGLVLASTGRDEEAQQEFRRGGCSDAQAVANLAFIQTMDDQWTAARDTYERALAMDPALESAQNGLASLDTLQARPNSNAPSPVRLVGTDQPTSSRTGWSSRKP